MKIGIDARLWNETGVGRYIRNLVENLLKIDSTNEYVLFVSKGFRIEDLGFKNKNWRTVETDIRWHTVEEQLQFPKILEKENLDLVHFPYFSVPFFYKGQFVITIHDLIINHFPTGKASTLPSPFYHIKLLGYKFVIRQAAHKACKIIAVSQATKKEIVKHLGVSQNKIIVTYEGVEVRDKGLGTGNRKDSIKNILPILNDSPFFLYVGNAYPHKNLERLVEAFERISKEYPDVKLFFVGKTDYFYRRLQEKVKALNIENNIIFTGFVPEEELGLYYKFSTAVIIPSLMEGFGLPGLEAMQSDCLVVASDIPVFKEIYQDAAIYFDPLEIEAMHATIREVLEKKKNFKTYIEKGRKRVLAFSWKRMAEETLKIYESCLSVRSDQ